MTTSSSDQMNTPAQTLAHQIVEQLLTSQLIRPADAADLQAKLATGTVKAEDWQLSIELGSEIRGDK